MRIGHTRSAVLERDTRVLCTTHRTLERVFDGFRHPNGLSLRLECGCDRVEAA
jgi:hypothetical protein